MRKLLPSLVILMLVPAVFLLSACTIGDGTFRAMDVTLKSLSEITGVTQNVTEVGNGFTTLQGRYHYRCFTFANNSDRDAAANRYREYLDEEGFQTMQPQLFSITHSTTLELDLIRMYGANTAFVGVDTSFNNKLYIILVVNP